MSDPNATKTDPALLEVRAAIDVMFEALSHLQASMETSSEDARAQAYQNFKDALYARHDYLMAERYGEGEGNLSDASVDPSPTLQADSDDTLEKFWPAIVNRS